MADEGCEYCRIESERRHAIILAFHYPDHDLFLHQIAHTGRFTLVIEGMVPVVISFNRNHRVSGG